ncbi:MAG: peptidylprolyl isomerase, partial [Pyrinomonadaceae bacterium]
ELAPDPAHARALADALPAALRDEMNDAALAILDALAKQKSDEAFNTIKPTLGAPDHLVRRRAAALLKEQSGGTNGAESQPRLGTVTTRNRPADYARAIGRIGRGVRAVVTTDKGEFTIELLAEDAPLTVDNFVELARRNFFDGITFHRVVPNFVIQGGDPRGDGNGGPGYQIRCEINTVPYGRGAVGMALSGKDTGGSQWFVTHSPQPHLDGGYTVFGRVVSGMETVDRIARGDRIRGVRIIEGGPPPAARTGRGAPKD